MAQSKGQEGHVHRQKFDGDDPYLTCECGKIWDAITGKELVEPQPTNSQMAQSNGDAIKNELRLNIAKQIVKARVPGYKMTNGELNDEARLVPEVYIDNIMALFDRKVSGIAVPEEWGDIMAGLMQLVMDSRKEDVSSDLTRISDVLALIKQHELDAREDEIRMVTAITGKYASKIECFNHIEPHLRKRLATLKAEREQL